MEKLGGAYYPSLSLLSPPFPHPYSRFPILPPPSTGWPTMVGAGGEIFQSAWLRLSENAFQDNFTNNLQIWNDRLEAIIVECREIRYISLREERTAEESPAEEKTAELITAICPKNRSYFFRSF